MEKRVWVYDLEQFENFHSATFVDRDDESIQKVFVIHSSRDDREQYYDFLMEDVSGLIGFNNINYDYPLLHFFIELMRSHKAVGATMGVNQLTDLLQRKSQEIIKAEYSAIPPFQVIIPQLDLFKIHHFDNKAKATSLKAVQIAINYPNVEDLPFHENHWVDEEEVPKIIGYNLNDVLSTRAFYFLSEDMVEMRKMLSKEFNLNLRNANDPKIGQEIFGREIARAKQIPYARLRDMRTYRHSINLGDCLLPYIYFESKEFKKLHTFFKETTITSTYKAFEKSVIYKGFKYDYGTGGIHGCIESGVYESTQDMMILDIDVAAYYPALGIQNKFYPQHLGNTFTEVYSRLFDTRMEAKRTGNKPVNSGLKLALNGVYGKSNDQYSLFYDPMYTMRITINGQLLLSMLSEWLVDSIRNLTMLQVNTDGITIMIPRRDEAAVRNICLAWEKKTGLILEYAEYKKMIIRDVNNYLAITTDGYAKPKSCFEITPMQNGAIAYNKNWSMRVVPKSLHAHYLEGVPIADFIRNHDNIYDFGIGFRARKDWNIVYTHIEANNKVKERQQRTIRYYVSTSGGSLTKQHHDGRVISLESGRAVKMFNQYYDAPIQEYGIDYNYYIAEANKIKYAVDDGQRKLF